MKVAVVTDSACGMSHLNIKMEGLYMIPLQITDGVDNYLEGVNITNDQCYQMMFMGKEGGIGGLESWSNGLRRL